MNLVPFAKRFGQARRHEPVRISVSDANETLGEYGKDGPQSSPSWAPVGRVLAHGHMLDLEFAERTDVGRVREHNEDFLGHSAPAAPPQVRTHGWMFVVADGVGGHSQGEVASRCAVECMIAGFRNAKGGESHSTLLQRLVQQANTRVLETAVAGGRDAAGMATTIVACALRYDRVAIAHVGDSRCYLIREGRAEQITRDHTFASEQVRLGLVSAQEAEDGSTSHILSRSLGTELVVNVETDDHQIFAGDFLLLCSDGLHNSVGASEMAAICGHAPGLAAAAEKLVGLANDRGGSDNISVQLIRVRNVERMGMYRGRPYKLH